MRKFNCCVLILLAIGCLLYAEDHFQVCDQTVEFPAPPVEERVLTRTFPSVFGTGPILVDGLFDATSEVSFEEWFELQMKDEYII